tara:strand:- start:85 stop:381 length:297 start_codon:yes stop_codon:yes gene_type:complete
MNMTMTEYDFVNQWPQSRNANFSREGLFALYDHLTQMEYECDIHIEYDPVAFCCEYTEYDNILEAVSEYDGFNTVEDFEGHTTVIQIPDTKRLIIQNF